MSAQGFCIYINTLCEGPVPVEHDQLHNPVVYQSMIEAQREIAECTIERLQQFLDGERDYEDAIGVEEYVVEVDALPDGSIIDGDGNSFGGGHG
jgi:hypothetical protein